MLAALVELVLIRPLYLRHIEQVLVTVGLSLALVALSQGIWGPTQQLVRDAGVALRHDDGPRCDVPNDRFVEIGVAVVVLVGLLAFLRCTRYGLIIRAGVENRAMVTALGIDVRKAFTLVFAIGGIAAALAGVLSGVYFGAIDPQRGTSLLIFAFIVVVIGGLGSIAGSAVAAVVVGLRPAVRELLRLVRASATSPSSCCSRSSCSSGPSGLAGAMAAGTLSAHGRHRSSPLAVFGVARARAEALVGHPTASSPAPLDSPGTLQLLALCLIFGGRRDELRPALRLHRPALVRARALLRGRRLRDGDRDDEVGLELWQALALHRARRARPAARRSARSACA